jgi:hypothetical protein
MNSDKNGFKRMNLKKINQNEKNLEFIKLISVIADFQNPLILFEKI